MPQPLPILNGEPSPGSRETGESAQPRCGHGQDREGTPERRRPCRGAGSCAARKSKRADLDGLRAGSESRAPRSLLQRRGEPQGGAGQADDSAFHVEHGAGDTEAVDRPPHASFHAEHERQLATLGSLVASIAHEINNILTPIASYADLARMHPDDEELTAKALQRAAAGARQASEIATAILSLATPDRGAAPSHCDDLRDIIHRSTLCLGSEPAARGVKVTWAAPQGLAPAMPAVALQHVLVNLLINALRASKRGGVIEVSAGPGSTWNLAEVTVRDAGDGIPAARQAGIFRDFESGCGSTGLGLAICRRLLEKWGGAIRLAETGPDGTVFAITAPIAGPAQQQSAA
jgi:signal transduction histidine kinase